MTLTLHLLVCYWIFLGESPAFPVNWLQSLHGTHIANVDDFIAIYIEVLFYMMATISGVGYGNIDLKDIPEQVSIMALQVFKSFGIFSNKLAIVFWDRIHSTGSESSLVHDIPGQK